MTNEELSKLNELANSITSLINSEIAMKTHSMYVLGAQMLTLFATIEEIDAKHRPLSLSVLQHSLRMCLCSLLDSATAESNQGKRG